MADGPRISSSDKSAVNYALVAGHGRSGTDWLLELLDRAATTHCRNEPNEISGNAFEALPSPFVALADPDAVAPLWSSAVAEAAAQMGERDRAPIVSKSHLASWVKGFGLVKKLSSPRARRRWALIRPAWRRAEWPMPGLRGVPLTILKCNQVPGWARFVLEHDAGRGRVVQIVRHPGGFLSSWRQHYLAEDDAAEVRRANVARLKQVARVDPAFAAVMGDPASHDLDESELWYWRYSVELIEAAGQASIPAQNAYHRILFEELALDPLEGTRELYGWLGLDWMPDIEESVVALSKGSLTIARRAIEGLSAAERDTIDRVLSGSVMEHWWD